MPFVVTSWAPKIHRASGSGRGKPSRIMHIGFFACFHCISLERSRCSFQENLLFNFLARVALKRLVSLIGLLVACSARIVGHTGTHTDQLL